MRKLTEHDIATVVGTTNSGYTIIKARIKDGTFSDSDHYGFVLAKNATDNYVTWQFHLDDEVPNYYWGHYFSEDEKAALEDYQVREQSIIMSINLDLLYVQIDGIMVITAQGNTLTK